ncbi:hypothetical protein [Candidatus Nitrosotalea okcheonensis]|nr:hypothetical protein [Candidatus Nitrosotalea okcheonensis]
MFTSLGRFNVRLPDTNYFIIMSTFTQIALLVVVTILLLEIRKSKNKKLRWSTTIIYVFFIAMEMIALSTSYQDGFKYEIAGYEALIPYLDCMHIPSSPEKCNYFNVFGDPKNSWESAKDVSTVFNILLERKATFFQIHS